MTDHARLVESHLVVHCYLPADERNAPRAYGALRELWSRCRHVLSMDQPIPGLALPHHLPETFAQLPEFVEQTIPECAVAAQQNADGARQALVRRHQDTLNLSVAIPVGEPAQATAEGPTERWPAWDDVDRQWDGVIGGTRSALLGEARIHLASIQVGDSGDAPARLAELPSRMRSLLPAGTEAAEWWLRGADTGAGCMLWELSGGDSRIQRRILALGDATRDPEVSAWLWSRGDAVLPPLGRYLLHTAKLRYEIRVWQRDHDDIVAAEQDDAADAEARASAMRRTVEIIADNMERTLGSSGVLAVDQGLFHDDRSLAAWFATQLDDDIAYLSASRRRRVPTTRQRALGQGPGNSGHDDAAGSFDPRRVFVIHGRDEQARARMFGFLRRLGLIPLEWESLVTATGSATPDIRGPIARGLALAAAVVAIMTPDDSVYLHPALGLPSDSPDEAGLGLQARPNVCFELGMAYAMYPTRTVITVAGHMRGVADLAALNFVRLDDSASCEEKIISRLRIAGCPAQEITGEPEAPGHFAGLSAWRRHPGS